jgi:hypothetical protein
MAKNNKWRIKEAVKIAEDAALKALRTGAEAILTEAIDETPVETGTLRRSGTVTVGGLPDAAKVYEAAEAGTDQKDGGTIGKEKAVYISFNTPYALVVHEGAAPHKITVDTAKSLAVPVRKWKGDVNPYGSGKLPMLSKDGKYVLLGRSVNHPGSTGFKYLENAFNRNKQKVIKYAQAQFKKALQKAK